jgi:hypothetical protein
MQNSCVTAKGCEKEISGTVDPLNVMAERFAGTMAAQQQGQADIGC